MKVRKPSMMAAKAQGIWEFLEMRLATKLAAVEKLSSRNWVDLNLARGCVRLAEEEVGQLHHAIMGTQNEKCGVEAYSNEDLRFFHRMFQSSKTKQNECKLTIKTPQKKNAKVLELEAKPVDTIKMPIHNPAKPAKSKSPKPIKKQTTPTKSSMVRKQRPASPSPVSALKKQQKTEKKLVAPVLKSSDLKSKDKVKSVIKEKKIPDYRVKLTVETAVEDSSHLITMKPSMQPFSQSENSEYRTRFGRSEVDSERTAGATLHFSQVSDESMPSRESWNCPQPAIQDPFSQIQDYLCTFGESQLCDSRVSMSEGQSAIEMMIENQTSNSHSIGQAQDSRAGKLESLQLSTALISIEQCDLGQPSIPSVSLPDQQPSTPVPNPPKGSRKIAPLSLIVREQPSTFKSEAVKPKQKKIVDSFNDLEQENMTHLVNRIASVDQPGLRDLIDKANKPAQHISKKLQVQNTEFTKTAKTLDKGNCPELGNKLPPRPAMMKYTEKKLDKSPLSTLQESPELRELSSRSAFDDLICSKETSDKDTCRQESQETADLLLEVDDLCMSRREFKVMNSECKRAVLADIVNSLQRDNLKDTLNLEILRKHIECTMYDDTPTPPKRIPLNYQEGRTKGTIPDISKNPKRLIFPDYL